VLDASASCSFFKNCCNYIDSDKICLLKTGNKTANINVKKLQFIHTVNGDRSKTAKVIKSNINHNNIDIQVTLLWLILPFCDFAVSDLLPLTVYINCSFFTFIYFSAMVSHPIPAVAENLFSFYDFECWLLAFTFELDLDSFTFFESEPACLMSRSDVI